MDWRTRVGLVSLVYLIYFGVAIVGVAVSASNDDARPGLIIGVTIPALHFCTSAGGMLMGNRVALRGSVLHVAVAADWVLAFALGLSSAVVSRTRASDETQVAIAACTLVALAQLGCAYKTHVFTDASRFDQVTGDSLE